MLCLKRIILPIMSKWLLLLIKNILKMYLFCSRLNIFSFNTVFNSKQEKLDLV